MKTKPLIFRIFINLFVVFFNGNLISQEINQKLTILKPLFNKTWEGKLKAPDGSVEFSVVKTFNLFDKGNIIKVTSANRDMEEYGEGYFYWDDLEKKIAFFFVESSGVFETGFVTSEGNMIIIEGKMTWPGQVNLQVKQSYDFKNTFEFTTENTMTDKWYMNAFGPWRTGHVIEFVAQPKKSNYSFLFYSGRTGNQDIFIKHPDQNEPINLTKHPAKDNCPAISPDGKIIVFVSDRTGQEELYTMNTDGAELKQLTSSPESKEHPQFSPDGRQIIFIKDFGEKTEIWMINSDGANPVQLTFNNCRDERPFISSDGTKVIFMSNRDGNYEIYTMNISGTEQTRITNTPYHEIFPNWSPDGTKITYAQKIMREGVIQGCLRVMNSDGSGDKAITEESTRDENPVWSPDGRLILFQSARDKNFEVYVINSDGSNPMRITNHPDWDGWASFISLK